MEEIGQETWHQNYMFLIKIRTESLLVQIRIEFGVQANGSPITNPAQAEALLEDYKTRGISSKEI